MKGTELRNGVEWIWKAWRKEGRKRKCVKVSKCSISQLSLIWWWVHSRECLTWRICFLWSNIVCSDAREDRSFSSHPQNVDIWTLFSPHPPTPHPSVSYHAWTQHYFTSSNNKLELLDTRLDSTYTSNTAVLWAVESYSPLGHSTTHISWQNHPNPKVCASIFDPQHVSLSIATDALFYRTCALNTNSLRIQTS